MKRIPLALLASTIFMLCSCASNRSSPVAATTSPSPSATLATSATPTAETAKMIINLEKKTWDVFTKPEESKKFYHPDYRSIYFGAIRTLEENMRDSKDIVIKNFSISDEKVTFPTSDTAILIYKFTSDSTYKGKKTDGKGIASSVWVKVGGEWKNALYTESPLVPAK
ncbi:MAG: nuclear transport factor 2 family protein [Acidobacteriota bacterium]